MIVDKFQMDDVYAVVRDGSAPVAMDSYHLTPLHLHVFRRVKRGRYTTTGEQIDRANTPWGDVPDVLHQLLARTVYVTPAELTDVAAQIRSAEQVAKQDNR
ncbi:MAG TPA: hypothetical protein VGI74_13485 [Streptosporangiaceae bacterium]|jgi:hypothetical protein